MTEELKPLRTKHLASKFGMKQTALRRVLRSMGEYADGVHTNYRWAEKDPMIAKIEARIKELAAKAQKAKEDAKAKLAAKAKEEAASAKADKK